MLKKIKPITPSLRQTILLKNNFTKKKPFIKSLIKGFQRSKGRNNQGKITISHRGGGHKRLYRKISFNQDNLQGVVESIEYDPNRSSFISLIKTEKGFKYILTPEGLKKGDLIQSGKEAPIEKGNTLSLKNIPLGSNIYNIGLKPKSGGQLIRSAGTFGQLVQKGEKYAKIRLKSGNQRLIPLKCLATIGSVSNINHKNKKLGKAGRSRWLNRRPHVRGVAMNPVDHPHGGGEGKTSGGRPSVTPKGIITKGKPTRKKNKNKNLVIKINKKK